MHLLFNQYLPLLEDFFLLKITVILETLSVYSVYYRPTVLQISFGQQKYLRKYPK